MNADGFASAKDVVTPHDYTYAGGGKVDVLPLYGDEQALNWLTVIGPAGSLCSTVEDLIKYAQFHCLITQKGIVCGNCARHCPTHAISMVENKDGRSYPQVDASRCIGCGSCEYHCPADPPAIAVTILRKKAGA